MGRKYKVLLTDPVVVMRLMPDMVKQNYSDAVDLIEFIQAETGDEEELLEKVVDVDIMMGGTKMISGKVIENAEKLFFIQQCGDGYDNINIEAARKKGVKVSNAGGAGAIAVSEHAIMLMLALSRSLISTHDAMKRGEWPQIGLIGKLSELHGKVLGIVGLGRIGTQTARLGHAYGMKLQCYSPHRKDTNNLAFPIKQVTLEELMKTSDFVSIHTVLNEDTKHLIGKRELEMMKETAYLINTARGAVVDEEALIEVLEKGKIKGAGIDVFGVHDDAPDKSSKLLKLDNVILTSHTAGATIENIGRVLVETSLGNMVQVVKGNEPQNRIV